MDTNIINKEPIALAEVSKIIQGLGNKTDRAEIPNKILEFNKDATKLKIDKVEKLIQELEALNVPLMSRALIVQIVDIVPKDLGELKSIFAGSKLAVSPENLKQMQDVISKYL